MDAFDVVNIVEETRDLPACFGKVLVIGKIDLLLLDGSHQALGVTVLAGFADGGHAEDDAEAAEAVDIGRGGVLDTLIGMMDLWHGDRQGPLQSGQRES